MIGRLSLPAASLAAAIVVLGGCGTDTPTSVGEHALLGEGAAMHRGYDGSSMWSPAIRVEDIPGTHPEFNGPTLDGCPFISADGRTFFMASTRPGGYGGIDIWVSTRMRNGRWGEPVNLGPVINTEHNDFCPTLAGDGRTFYFASNRPGGCGGDDLYVTTLRRVHDRKRHGEGTWVADAPRNLGCQVNSAANEHGPSPVHEPGSGLVLYFSSFRAGGYSAEPVGAVAGDADIYRSVWRHGAFGSAELVPGVNTEFHDSQPNIRQDAREIFFFSNRPGSIGGSNDIWASNRRHARGAWSAPENLGPNVNSAASETRPSLSSDGRTLYFGSDRPGGEGSSDHYVTFRRHRGGWKD